MKAACLHAAGRLRFDDLLALALLAWLPFSAQSQSNPILFVTQVPLPTDYTTVNATFGNHRPEPEASGRGGDLWIRYPDGSLKNLTRAAGYGQAGDQSTNGIAVRQPCVHWDGHRALFSMVVGTPRHQFDYDSAAYWQIYEISGFASPDDTPVVSRIARQPEDCNNVSPIYTSDDDIVFTSDRPRSGERHLYPQLDEYEGAPTVSGIWRLNPATGRLFLLQHSPSGSFNLGLDSFGRILFTRWDHLQRDQQADSDNTVGDGPTFYGSFNFSDESLKATRFFGDRREVFPESRIASPDLNRHLFNQFFPWQINQDGTAEETLNHVGRHELGGSYIASSFTDDPNLRELYDFSVRPNPNPINNLLQLRESPTQPGLFYGVDAPEFGTHSAGQIVTLNGAPSVNPEQMHIDYLTPRSTSQPTLEDSPIPTDHSGLYRNPLPLTDGSLVAVHTRETRYDRNLGSSETPVALHAFRLTRLKFQDGYFVPDSLLTPGLHASVSYWSPDYQVSYSDTALWELDPVEVVSRRRPALPLTSIAPPELAAFQTNGIDVEDFRRALTTNDLSLLISRNVTTRDRADLQQPFNLRIPDGTQTRGASGRVYSVAFLQVFQADQIRGFGLLAPTDEPRPGRRVLAQPLHTPNAWRPTLPTNAPPGSFRLGADGSMAAIVPARRALSWQLVDPDGLPVVRERYWITTQPGEIRTCTSCHGINVRDQANQPAPTNTPAALIDLLAYWKQTTGYAVTQDPITLTAEISRTPAGNLRLHGVVGLRQPTILESSTDLLRWIPLVTNPPGQSVFELGASRDDTARFFRLRH